MASFAQLNASEGLPSSVHTEVAILGAMLLDSVAISDATEKLKAEDFSLDSHQRVYRAIVDLMQLGAGLAAAIAVLVRFKFLNEILYPVLSLPLLAIAFTCLFSALMLVVMLFVASVVGEVLPDKISLASFGGLWSGVLVMCSGRTVEAGLHQAIDGVVERIVTRR